MQAAVRAPLPAVRCHGSVFLQPHPLLTPRAVSVRAQQQDRADRQPGPAGAQQQNDLTKAQGYYAGLLKSDIRNTNDASSADMLSRSLQLAGEYWNPTTCWDSAAITVAMNGQQAANGKPAWHGQHLQQHAAVQMGLDTLPC